MYCSANHSSHWVCPSHWQHHSQELQVSLTTGNISTNLLIAFELESIACKTPPPASSLYDE